MSLLYMDGFDAQDADTRWTVYKSGNGTLSYPTSTRLAMGTAVNVYLGGGMSYYGLLRSFTASSKIFLGAAIQNTVTAGNSYGTPFHIILGDGGTTCHLYLLHTATEAIALYRGSAYTGMGSSGTYSPNGTQLAVSPAGVMDNNWHYIELSATLDSSVGTVVVKVDGTQVINFTGNTKNGGTSTNIDTIGFTSLYANIKAVGGVSVDDLYVCDTNGSTNNTFLGDVQVQTLLPTAAGSSTQFVPTGSANNYANVNDVPDSASTYNSSSTVGQRDTYAMGDLAAGAGTIYGIQQVMHAFKTTSGTANVKAAQQSGASVSYGTVKSLGTSNEPYIDVFENNPATGVPYTASDVNGLEAGAEVA